MIGVMVYLDHQLKSRSLEDSGRDERAHYHDGNISIAGMLHLMKFMCSVATVFCAIGLPGQHLVDVFAYEPPSTIATFSAFTGAAPMSQECRKEPGQIVQIGLVVPCIFPVLVPSVQEANIEKKVIAIHHYHSVLRVPFSSSQSAPAFVRVV